MVLNYLLLPIIIATSSPSNRYSLLVDRVDLIELNHCFDDLGRHLYDQIVFYEWSPDYRRHNVIAWCMVEDDLNRLPVRLPGSREYCVRWQDRDARVKREVRSANYRETWTEVDPERANKKVLDEKNRTSLLRARERPLLR